MVDEQKGEVAPADLPRAFNRQSVWRRIAIVVAGPLANLLLAVLLFAGTYMVGVPGQRAVLAPPPPGSPAAAAGLADGDLVAAVDGDRVRSWQDMRWRLLRASGSDGVVLTVERPDGSTSARPMSLSTVASTDWEGNFLSALGLKIRPRASGRQRSASQQTCGRCGTPRRRRHPRRRRQAGAFTWRCRGCDQCTSGRTAALRSPSSRRESRSGTDA